jgi:hypothetical protein
MKKKVFFIMLSVVLIIIIGVVIWNNSGVTVAGRCAKYVLDYRDYFDRIEDKNIRPFLDFGTGGASGYKVWIKLGQKEKLLAKIREDVNDELTTIMENHSDVFKSYEISDDFRKITIYRYNGKNLPVGINLSAIIDPKMELYHQLIYGYGNSSFENNELLNYFEIDESFLP